MVDISDPVADDGGQLRRPLPPPTWRDRIEGLADATGTTPARILVGVVAVGVLAATATWWLRPVSPPPEVSLPFASTTIPTAPASSIDDSIVVVHVAGAVVEPGLQELAPGARVADAIAAAGGLTTAADATQINLAAPVSDGERVYVVAVGESAPLVAVGGAAAGGDPSAAEPVDLNAADVDALDALPGVGPATAAAIVRFRTDVGAFTAVDQLLDVPGIGDAKLEALRDLVRV